MTSDGNTNPKIASPIKLIPNKKSDECCNVSHELKKQIDQHSHEKQEEKEKTPEFIPPYSFYRRILPSPPAIPFGSKEGRELFREAMKEGYMEGYFYLAEQFRTQDEPAFCGLSTLTMVLNTLSVDPKRIWKGPWRWYTERMLDCCLPLSVVKHTGILLEEFICIAQCNGVECTLKRPNIEISHTKKTDENGNTEEEIIKKELKNNNNSSKEYYDINEFRKDVKFCTKHENEPILVVSYSRKEFLQTGDGHFTPIGGYNESKDLVLLMDVARYKYPPHWVPLKLLFNSMGRLEPFTKQNRGWLLIKKSIEYKSLFFTFNNKNIVNDRISIMNNDNKKIIN